MKITDNSEVHFKDIDIGAVFKCNDIYFMKTHKMETNDSEYNSVCLNDGEYEFFAQLDRVTLINCELVVL